MKRALPLLAVTITLLVTGCSSKYRIDRDDLGVRPVWPYYHGDLAAQGALPDGKFSGKLDVVWEHDAGDKPIGPMTIYHNQLVYPGGRNKIRFISLSNGALSGHIKPKGIAQTGLVVYKGLGLFAVGPKNSLLKCINLSNGDKEWSRHLSDATSGALIVNDLFVVGVSSGVLEAFRPHSGEIAWRFTAESRFNAPATFDGERVYQPGDNGILYALSPVDGTERLRVELDAPIAGAVAVADLIYATDIDGHVYGIDKQGEIVWNRELDGPIWTSPAVASGRVFVGHSGGEIVALDAATGKTIWKFNAVDVVRASPVVIGDFVIAGTLAGKLFSLRVADGSVADQRQLRGAIRVSPVSDGENIFVATDKGYLTCLGKSLLAENSEK